MRRRGFMGLLASAGFIGTTPAGASMLTVAGTQSLHAPPLNIPDGSGPSIGEAYGVVRKADPLSAIAEKQTYLVNRIGQAKAASVFRKWLFKKAPDMIGEYVGPTPYTEPRDDAHYGSMKSLSPVAREYLKRRSQSRRAQQFWLDYPEQRMKKLQFQLLNLDKNFDDDF